MISVIVPFYQEEQNVAAVLQELSDVLKKLKRDFEIIAVDDGSTDQTLNALLQMKQSILELCILKHKKNCGQGVAFYSGFQKARGEILVTMDGDGQNDPHDIPSMLVQLENCQAVLGVRKQRKDPASKRWVSKIANRVRSFCLNDDFEDTGCSLKVMKKEVLSTFLEMKGFFRFIPFFMKEAGMIYQPMEVHHRPRKRGTSKYALSRIYFLEPIGDFLFCWWYKKQGLKKTVLYE